jgi:tryptophan 2,3-dioxygenase
MVDFATLVLAADSRSLKTGEHALESIASTAERTEARTNKATGGLSKGYQQVGKQSIFAGHQSRMMAMQLSQVAQQASATGNWVQALAIQLPDLTLGFGVVGIAAGVVAGALLPLVANMVSAGEEAETLEDALSRIEDVTSGLKGSLDILSMSVDELAEKYGTAAQRVYEYARVQAELRASIAEQDLRAQVDVLGDLASKYTTVVDAGRNYRNVLQRLQDDFGLTSQQAREFEAILGGLAEGATFADQQQALAEINQFLAANNIEASNLPPELQRALDQMITLSNATDEARAIADQLAAAGDGVASSFGAAADQAARMAAATASALQARAVIDQLNQNGPLNTLNVFNSTPFQNEGEILSERWAQNYADSQAEWEKRQPKARKAKATNSITDQMNDASRIFDETRTAAERYASELRDLQELQEMGYLSADTYARAVAKVGEEYYNASEHGQFFSQISEDLKNGILDAIIEGDNLADTFENLAKSIARAALEAAIFGSGPLAGRGGAGSGGQGILGGLLGGLGRLFSFDGGGSTGSGSRSGGMDGKGGFLAMLHPNETVIDHTKGGSGPAAQIHHWTIQNTFDGEMVRTTIRDESSKVVAQSAPGIVNQAVAAVGAKSRRNPGYLG